MASDSTPNPTPVVMEEKTARPAEQLPIGVERFRPQMIRSWRRLRQTRRLVFLMLAWLLRKIVGALDEGHVGILMYHRTCDVPSRLTQPPWNVSPRLFRRQLRHLLDQGFLPVSLPRLLQWQATASAPPGKYFAVTFDDGYESVYRHAFPILCELQVPATIFLATAYLDRDQPFPFDDWALAGSRHVPSDAWRPLTTQQCHAMLSSGWITLGSHSHWHENYLGRPESFRNDLNSSLDKLRDDFGIAPPPMFAYPFGCVDPSLEQVCEDHQLHCTLRTTPCPIDPTSLPSTWGRLEMSYDNRPWQIVTRMDGWHVRLEKCWKGMFAGIGKHNWLNSGFLSIIDQSLVSGGSFFAAFLLGRSAAAELALYYLAVQSLWIFRTIQNHLVIFPMKVLLPQEAHPRPDADSRLVGILGLNHFISAIACVLCLVAAGISATVFSHPEFPMVFLGLAMAAPMYLQREYLRQVFLTCLQPASALAVDAVTIVAQVLGLIGLALGQHLTAITVFALIAVSNFLSVASHIPRKGQASSGRGRPGTTLLSEWQTLWEFGRWNLATDGLTSVLLMTLSWIVQLHRGLEETAVLAAAVIPVGMASIVVNGIMNVQLPRATRALAREGTTGLVRELHRTGIAVFGSYALLAIATYMIGPAAFAFIYGGENFRQSYWVALASLASAMAGTLGYVGGTGLMILSRGKINFFVENLQFVLAVAICIWLSSVIGAQSVPVSTAIAVLVGGMIRYPEFLRQAKRLERSTG